jgi:hypothetical protein
VRILALNEIANLVLGSMEPEKSARKEGQRK